MEKEKKFYVIPAVTTYVVKTERFIAASKPDGGEYLVDPYENGGEIGD